MVEVFKTDVRDQQQANKLIDLIHNAFPEYKANFDLEDCDRILRVKSSTQLILAAPLIQLLHKAGYHAEVLPDDEPSMSSVLQGRSTSWMRG
ncbi:hypothetical protein [Chitinophaga defluvii]|uniref:Copper chaperone CopZ n=1 Tax=Chitinophaga defluvii TaxID=3163343 RepID=A0ABV2TBN6_9BACT